MSRANRITAPLANKTQYVVNARFDVINQRNMRKAASEGKGCGPQLTGANTHEIFNINEHELVFRCVKCGGGSSTKYATYNDGRVYVFSALNGLDPKKVQVALAGIAQGSSSGIEDRMHQQGLAIQREGVNTVINTGKDAIRPGQKVYWKLPPVNSPDDYAQDVCGVPKHKRCAILTTTNPDSTKGDLHRVGLALSHAQSGRPLDILFQPGY
mgnify:CR=1 FL=1